ncbi:MAG: hypothetical protein NW226_17550 [Microscillaceae bacterium]|nr:hypothetical protein [Microscillaceae bacterium]
MANFINNAKKRNNMAKLAKRIEGLPRGYAQQVLERLEGKSIYISISVIYKVAQGRRDNEVIRLEILNYKLESLELQKQIRDRESQIKDLENDLK